MGDYLICIDNELKKSIVGYLSEFMVSVGDEDTVFDLILKEVIQDICNFLNITKVPKELEHVVIRRVVGKYLEYKANRGELECVNDGEIKAITEGDVKIELNDSPFDVNKAMREFIDNCLVYGKDELYSFRRIKW